MFRTLIQLSGLSLDVCKDLQLPPAIARMVLNPTPLIPEDPTSINTEALALRELQQRIIELEKQLRHQPATTATTAPKTNTTSPTIVHNGDIGAQRQQQMYSERRKRAKTPIFSNGNATVAHHWIEKYTRHCAFLGFTDQERLDELNLD